MCGIAGCYDLSHQTPPSELATIAAAMSDPLRHRGPDDGGVWVDDEAGAALGHRRLSILDLSPAGHQPMISCCGRYVLTYNGEIYNFQELRDALAEGGRSFRGHSDTEVLLAAIVEWGVRGAVERLNGMFAFAVWDKHRRTLTLGRDPLGIKPLYYGWFGSHFLFGSELKSLRRHPAFHGEIDRNVLALFLKHGYIPAPCCIFRRVRKLSPGSLLTVTPDSTAETAAPVAYWSIADAVAAGKSRPFAGTAEDAAAALQDLLSDAVRRQMVADVPVGVFLSGGIDSSLVTALAQAEAGRPIRAFTMGFDEATYDESRFAREIAAHLNVDHHVQIVTSAQARDVIPRLPTVYDEPFADSSQIPTFLLSQLAREQVTVCLSGDGGDELFGGYHRYADVSRIRRKIDWVPRPVLRQGAQLYDRVTRKLRGRVEPGMAARIGAARDGLELYRELQGHWPESTHVVVDGRVWEANFDPHQGWIDLGNGPAGYIESMMAYDAAHYLPDDILTKVDRASMAVSLEVRVPILDQRVVELAWSFAQDLKRTGDVGKQPLRTILARFVPSRLFERPKMGFGVPIDHWLRGPLREWGEDLLHPRRLEREGWLHAGPVWKKWEEHQSGQTDWQYLLWDVLMFQAWLQENR